MKLNPDCVRDVLIYLEEHLGYEDRDDAALEHSSITIRQIADALSKEHTYSIEDASYAVEQLLDAEYIRSSTRLTGGKNTILYCPITDITWKGHDLLNDIRPKSVWEATKQGASKLGIMSIHALSTIAISVTQAVVTDPMVIGKIVGMIK